MHDTRTKREELHRHVHAAPAAAEPPRGLYDWEYGTGLPAFSGLLRGRHRALGGGLSSGVIVIDQVTLGRLRVEWLGGLVGCMMLGDEDDARAGYCETELMSAQGLETNAVGFDARSTLTDFRGIGWFRKFGKSLVQVFWVWHCMVQSPRNKGVF